MSILDRFFGREAAAPAPRVEPQMTGEASGVSSPAPWLEAGWGAPSKVKGMPIATARAAERHATVFASCNVIAGDLAKVPLQVVELDGDGRAVPVKEHSLSYLLNVESSPGVPAMVLRYAIAYAFTLRGRSYAYAPRTAGGEPELIEAVLPDRCAWWLQGRAPVYEFEDLTGTSRRVTGRNMVHLRYMAADGWTGRSPIEVAAESMGLAIAGEQAAARSAAGTNLKAVAKVAAFYQDDETYERSKARLTRSLTALDNGGVPVIGTEDDIKTLNISAADMQLLESRKFDREMIAAIYRVPPAKLQMLEFGVKANSEQQAIDYKTDCLLHWGGFVGRGLALGLLTEGERRRGLALRHDYDALMEATTKERIEADVKEVGGPIKTVNEKRRERGLDPIEGGDVLYPPANMTRDADKKGTDE